MRKLCQHCQAAPICRPRGLCWCCYYRPGVRDCYPPQLARQGVADSVGQRPPPPWPTDARPGSRRKVEVLCQRASKRWDLWHPEDAR